jgi:hypothetical protein
VLHLVFSMSHSSLDITGFQVGTQVQGENFHEKRLRENGMQRKVTDRLLNRWLMHLKMAEISEVMISSPCT